MLPLGLVHQLFDYNYWARDRQLEACEALTPEQFRRPLGNSFSSLQETLTHLLIAEWLWHERFRGRSPRTVPDAAEFATLSSLAERWRIVERDMREYLAGLSEEMLVCPLTYANLRGEQWTYPLWRVLLHLVNHQTYHRGQVTTLLRQLGTLPEPVDLLVADDMGLFKDPPWGRVGWTRRPRRTY